MLLMYSKKIRFYLIKEKQITSADNHLVFNKFFT